MDGKLNQMIKALKHPLTTLIFGFIVGVIALYYFQKNSPPISVFDPKPWQDTIEILKQEKIDYHLEGDLAIQRAEAEIQRLKNRNQKLKNDIEAIKGFTPDLRVHWHDSTMRAAGLR